MDHHEDNTAGPECTRPITSDGVERMREIHRTIKAAGGTVACFTAAAPGFGAVLPADSPLRREPDDYPMPHGHADISDADPGPMRMRAGLAYVGPARQGMTNQPRISPGFLKHASDAFRSANAIGAVPPASPYVSVLADALAQSDPAWSDPQYAQPAKRHPYSRALEKAARRAKREDGK